MRNIKNYKLEEVVAVVEEAVVVEEEAVVGEQVC
jgi:hypothetical protein